MSRFDVIRDFSPSESAVIDTYHEKTILLLTGNDRQLRAQSIAAQLPGLISRLKAEKNAETVRVSGGYKTRGLPGHPDVPLPREQWVHEEPIVEYRMGLAQPWSPIGKLVDLVA